MKFNITRVSDLKKVDTDVFNRLMDEYRQALDDLCEGRLTDDDITEYLTGMIAEGRGGGRATEYRFWGFDEPEHMPSDSRVYYFYQPTYLNVAFMMKAYMVLGERANKIDGFVDTLKRGMQGSTGRGFQSDFCPGEEPDCSRALEPFIKAGAADFVKAYPDFCPEFTDLFLETTEIRVFVYGTLMNGEANHDSFLRDAEYMGECTAEYFRLYDLGSYPGMVYAAPDKRHKGVTKVAGELYKVDAETLRRLDMLEGEGSLYRRVPVMLRTADDKMLRAQAYVYMCDVDKSRRIPADAAGTIRWNRK